MSIVRLRRLLPVPFTVAVVAFAGAGAATAQLPAAAPVAPDPLDASAPTLSWVYRSPLILKGDKGPMTGTKPGADAWVEANRTVGAVGGWRSYAREAQADASPHDAHPTGQPMQPPAQPASAAGRP